MQIDPTAITDVLRYDPEIGHFFWRQPGRKRVMNRPAGNLAPNGYRYIRVGGKLLCAHRVAWLCMTGAWPDLEIDHINGLPADNRWANLRAATSSQNSCNQGISSRNTSGLKGVSWYRPGQKWRAYIQVAGKFKSLGYFSDKYVAHAAYVAAAQELHGEFARAA